MIEPMPVAQRSIRPGALLGVLFLLFFSNWLAGTEPGVNADGPKVDEEAFKKSIKTGKNYYGYCMFCHARDGKGTRLPEGGTMAPPLVGSKRVLGDKEISMRILLNGLTGKVDGVAYEKPGVEMKPPPDLMNRDDAIMAGLLNYIRNSWGNEAPMITPEDIKRTREATANRKKPWTVEELMEKFGKPKPSDDK